MDRGRIVLVGTGTGIGKTQLGVALLTALTSAGVEVAGLKPVESGVQDNVTTDAQLLAGAASFHVKPPPPYLLAAPLSPHVAAPMEGITICLSPILHWVNAVAADWVLVETAGALLSPLAPGLTNLDLTVALEPAALILVAPDRLGVLHDVTAALFALRTMAPQLPEPVVALQAPPEPDASTGTNGGELMALGISRAAVTFPRAAPGTQETQVVVATLLRMLAVGLPATSSQ